MDQSKSSIFHAFNMRYTAIRDIAPRLVEMGFSHIQFPPIQTTRTLSASDGELLRDQIKQRDRHLASFHESCLKAQEKSRLYTGHIFDYMLRARVEYINQPLLRTMYDSLLNGVPYSELLEHTYQQIYAGKIKSAVVDTLLEIMDIGKKHPSHLLLEVADKVLGGIDPLAYDEENMAKLDAEIMETQSKYEAYSKEIGSLKKAKVEPPKNLVTTCSEHQLKLRRLRLMKSKCLEANGLLTNIQQTTTILRRTPLSRLTTKVPMPPFDQKNATQLLNRICFYEYILYPPWWLIYQPIQLAVGDTFLGTHAEIVEAIQACKSHGLQVITDIIVNNLAAVAGERSTWSAVTKSGGDWTAAPPPAILRLKQLLQDAFGSDDLTILNPPKDCKKEQEPTDCWMSLALPQLNQSHPLVRDAQSQFMTSLAKLGVDGLRIDAAAHISPVNCQRIINTFEEARRIFGKQSSPSISYIEYVGGSEFWRKYKFPDYEHVLRLEDFDIGESLYNEIFSASAQLERTVNYANKRLKRYSNLDSVVMLINHDHVMGSIPSTIYSSLPSKATYELSLAYLIQRVYGHVLLMPHDISSDMILQAIGLRKLMREYNIVREYVDVHNSIMISYKYDAHDKCTFIIAFNLHISPQRVLKEILEPLTFQWIYNKDEFIVSNIRKVYNRRYNTLMRSCYPVKRNCLQNMRRKTLKQHKRTHPITDPALNEFQNIIQEVPVARK